MNVCVFCGSGKGSSPKYAEAATQLASLLVLRNSTLVYGGGNIGLMGVIADEVLKLGGNVIGVIPDFLVQREVAHKGLTKLVVVTSMHERKRRMADLADAFIALPGGIGTLDELAEILTWKQLGLVESPIGILNTEGYFNPLLEQLRKMTREGFLKTENLDAIKIAEQPANLLTSVGVVAV